MAEFQRPTFEYTISPIGEAGDYPWITKPDTKYKDDGEFHVALIVDPKDEGVPEWLDQIKADAELAFQSYIDAELAAKRLNKGTAKQWSIYVPFEDELDEEGEPTGRKVVQFKQSHKLKLRDGTEKSVKIGVWDANDKPIPEDEIPAIFGGSKLRIKSKARFITVVSAKQVGIRLDFPMVQIVELAESNGAGGASGFGAVAGGFTKGAAPSPSQEEEVVDDEIPF